MVPTGEGFVYLEAPRDRDLVRLLEYWSTLRRGGIMPSRADIDPAALGWVLPDLYLIEVVPPPDRYRMRLLGGSLIDFFGENMAGRPVRETLLPTSVDAVMGLLEAVVAGREPRFVTGPVFWLAGKSHKLFEACYLPLSTDGKLVDMIFGAIKSMPAGQGRSPAPDGGGQMAPDD